MYVYFKIFFIILLFNNRKNKNKDRLFSNMFFYFIFIFIYLIITNDSYWCDFIIYF